MRSLKRADAIITICPALQEQVQRTAPWAMEKHQLIENSIFEDVRMAQPATAQTNPATAGTAADSASMQASDYSDGLASVVYAGTLEAYQGIDLLLDAIALLVKQRSDFKVIIAGGRADQVDNFKARSSELGITEHCTFLGQILPKQARDLASSATIILSPRSNGTNTPLKTYEQLACGVPLIATDIYSHTQVLDESLALLVPPSADGLAQGIQTLLDDPQMGQSMVTKAQAHYEEFYSRPAYLRKLKALFELVA